MKTDRMLYLLASILIQVGLIVHVVRTGRNVIWIYVLLFLPVAGPIAYLIVEVLPGLSSCYAARRALRRARRVVDPDRELRRASGAAAIADTVGARSRLAVEYYRRGRYREAIDAYRAALRGLYEHDPDLLLGLAQAEFAVADAAAARATLEELTIHNPSFKSDDARLLKARVLDAVGDLAAAESAYRTLAPAYPGAEAKVRYAALLTRLGKADLARGVLEEVLATARLAPRHVRRAQAEWLNAARREIAALNAPTSG